eukprot:5262115-Amphidinium_carterae.2
MLAAKGMEPTWTAKPTAAESSRGGRGGACDGNSALRQAAKRRHEKWSERRTLGKKKPTPLRESAARERGEPS